MKSAKEMFEELDYKQTRNDDCEIIYKRGVKPRPNHNNSALPKEIKFWVELNCIDFKYGRQGSYLYLELLQAINKQVEELHWNDTTVNIDVKLDGKKVIEAMRGD